MDTLENIITLRLLLIILSMFSLISCKAAIEFTHNADDSDDDSDDDTDDDYGKTIPTTCEIIKKVLTSVGCEFYAVDMNNKLSEGAPYAIVISNPQSNNSAKVTIEHGKTGIIYSKTLAAGELEEVLVTCDKTKYDCLLDEHHIGHLDSVALKEGFRISSDIPIMAYQWNTLYSENFTEDASLLFPIESLGTEYIAASWNIEQPLEAFNPSGYSLSGTVNIVFTADNTEFSFSPWQSVRYDVHDASDWRNVSAGEWSDKRIFNALDVVELSGFQLDDISGTKIIADKPIAVFGGHVCVSIPLHYGTCDHVEEQTLPVSRWGTEAVLAGYGHRELCTNDKTAWHIIAGVDDMRLTFDPPAPSPFNAEYTIPLQGQVIEFFSDKNHFVRGIKNNPDNGDDIGAPFQAIMGMPGNEYANCEPIIESHPDGLGDPMIIQVPAAGQYLSRYVFNTDKVMDYLYDLIIITRKPGTVVTLECLGEIPDSLFSQVGKSGWEVARVFIDDPEDSNPCRDGVHTITSTTPVGVMVAGISPAGSYGYLAGIGTKIINDVIIE